MAAGVSWDGEVTINAADMPQWSPALAAGVS